MSDPKPEDRPEPENTATTPEGGGLNDAGNADRRQRAENILSVHVSQLDAKEAPDIDALCAEHPGLADELRSLLEELEAKGGFRTLTTADAGGPVPKLQRSTANAARRSK